MQNKPNSCHYADREIGVPGRTIVRNEANRPAVEIPHYLGMTSFQGSEPRQSSSIVGHRLVGLIAAAQENKMGKARTKPPTLVRTANGRCGQDRILLR